MITQIIAKFKLRNSLNQFTLYLSIFALLATFDTIFQATGRNQLHMLVIVALMVWSGCAAIYSLRNLMHQSGMQALNIAVTTLILYLLIDPSNALILFPITVMVAMITKLYRFRSQPLVNPSAAGLFISFYLSVLSVRFGILKSPLLISWWGADMTQNFLRFSLPVQYAVAAVLLAGFVYFAYAFRKLPYTLSFFIVTCILFLGTSHDPLSNLSTVLFSSTAFMIFVMLSEPKTSPVFTRQQIAAGILGGSIYFVLTHFHIPLISGELAIINVVLLMNLITHFFKRTQFLK